VGAILRIFFKYNLWRIEALDRETGSLSYLSFSAESDSLLRTHTSRVVQRCSFQLNPARRELMQIEALNILYIIIKGSPARMQ